MSYSVVNWSRGPLTERRSTLEEAIEAITEPTDFVGAGEEWGIIELPSSGSGARGTLLSSEGEGHRGAVSPARAKEFLELARSLI